MNGTRIDYEMYAWQPETDKRSAAADYFVSDGPPPPSAVSATQGMTVVPAARESVLSRPVGDVLNSVVGDSVLSRPVSEVLSSVARDSVLSRPVGEVLSSARRSLGRRHDLAG